MKTLSVITILAAAASASAQIIVQNFKLTAQTYRGNTPAFSGLIDLASDFSVGINRNNDPTYAGFVQYMNFNTAVDVLPKGPLFRQSDDAKAFLVPTTTPGLYDFMIHPMTPVNALDVNAFSISTLSCGGNCGGLQLKYGEDNANGQWLAYDVPSGGYKIQYWNGAGSPPAGGKGVWLIKSSV